MDRFERDHPELVPFADVLQAFVDGTLDQARFAARYRGLFASDTVQFGGTATRALNDLYRQLESVERAGISATPTTPTTPSLVDAARHALDVLRGTSD